MLGNRGICKLTTCPWVTAWKHGGRSQFCDPPTTSLSF